MPPVPLLDRPVGVMTPLEPPEAPGIFRSGGRVCTVSGREVSRQAVRSEKPAAHSALGGNTAMAAQRYSTISGTPHGEGVVSQAVKQFTATEPSECSMNEDTFQ